MRLDMNVSIEVRLTYNHTYISQLIHILTKLSILETEKNNKKFPILDIVI